MHRAIRKHGPENFAISILRRCHIEDLSAWEEFYIEEHATLTPGGYNLTIGGDGVLGLPLAIRRRQGRKLSARFEDPAFRTAAKKRSKDFYASVEGEACKLRIAASLRGRKLAPAECANHTKGLNARYARPEEREKSRQATLAHYASPAGVARKQALSIAAKRRAAAGNYHSIEARKVLSEKATAQWARYRAEKAAVKCPPS